MPICKLCLKPSEPEKYIKYRIRELMEEKQLCFNCAFWMMKWEQDTQERPQHTVVIINGMHYVVHPEFTTNGFMKGFGGAHFKIKFHNGTEVETTNLWCQGEIPDHLKHLFPDNAEFIKQPDLTHK